MDAARLGARDRAGRPAQASALVQANRARYTLGALEAWYIAGPDRLEQGWTVERRPAGAGPLLLAFAEAGQLRAELAHDGQGLDLRDAAGVSSLRYDGLLASDARGRRLPARFTRQGDGLAIAVDDTAASYPLTIDPWLQAGTLAAAGIFGSLPGNVVSVSADGGTVVVSAAYNGSSGAVSVYTRPAGGWTTSSTPAAILTNAAGTSTDEFGTVVALSADGSTIVVSAPNNAAGGTKRGAAYVYIRPAGGWATTDTPNSTLANVASQDQDYLGAALALDADGSTIALGTPFNGILGLWRGAVYVYAKPAGGWVSTGAPTATLIVTASYNGDKFGSAVALSADGNTLAGGAPGSGVAYIYTKPAGGWVSTGAPTARLSNAAEDISGGLFALALSANGSTLAGGAFGNNAGGSHRGAVYVYTKPAGGWASTSTPAATLTNAAGADGDGLGYIVALSGDGRTLVANAHGISYGAEYVYTKPAGGWASTSTPAAKLAGTGAGNNLLGQGLALSSDGRTIVGVVARGANAFAYLFTYMSTNANLSGLALSQGTLSPSFASDISAYTATVPYHISSITVTPTVADVAATVTVNGAPVSGDSASEPISLNEGTNLITVVVTAADGTTSTTTIITVTHTTNRLVWLPVIMR